MNKEKCKQRLGLDIGVDEKAIEQSKKFSLERMAEETIKVYRK
jgi:hypothetical protein